jgi:hypothetical protein
MVSNIYVRQFRKICLYTRQSRLSDVPKNWGREGGREGGKGRGLALVMQFVMDEQKHRIKKRDIIFLQEIKTTGSLVVDKIDG